jgi:hypothetical protein
LDLTDGVPEHSTFSKNRHGRFRDSDVFRQTFEVVVARCIKEGIVSGQRLAVDASLIAADANRQNASPVSDWTPDMADPQTAPRAVREYLEALDDAAFSAATSVQPKFTSHSDPASQWTVARKGSAFFAYSSNYLVDTDNAVIVDVEATRSVRQAELGALQTMLGRTHHRLNIHQERMIADTACGTGPLLEWLVEEQDIAPHIPVFDKSGPADGTFERATHPSSASYCQLQKCLSCSGRRLKADSFCTRRPSLIFGTSGSFGLVCRELSFYSSSFIPRRLGTNPSLS